MCVAMLGRYQDLDALPGQLALGIAEESLDLAIGEQDPAVRVDHQHSAR